MVDLNFWLLFDFCQFFCMMSEVYNNNNKVCGVKPVSLSLSLSKSITFSMLFVLNERSMNGNVGRGRNTEYQFLLPFSLSLISKLEIFKSISFNQKFGCQFIIIMTVIIIIRKAHTHTNTLFAENIITKILCAKQPLLPLPFSAHSTEHVIFWPLKLRFTNHQVFQFLVITMN